MKVANIEEKVREMYEWYEKGHKICRELEELGVYSKYDHNTKKIQIHWFMEPIGDQES